MRERLDGRSAKALTDEMLRRAVALLGPDGQAVEPGKVEQALIGVAARIDEEVTRRLDKVPDKQADNFYAAMGIGRDPARAARVPVAIKLSDTAPDGLVAPAGTKLAADIGGPPAIFETRNGIALARGSIVQLIAVDLVKDQIFVTPPAVLSGQLPRPAAIGRTIKGGAGPGATVLQIDPATDLAEGMMLRLGVGPGSSEYGIVKVEGDLVTIEPGLATTYPEETPAVAVTDFAPFEPGARNRQSHALYLSHAALLDVPAGISILVAGVEPADGVIWEWFGKIDDDDQPSWQAFEKSEFTGARWELKKPKGKPEKTEVEGRKALWIRARLPGASTEKTDARNIRIAVSGGDRCALPHHERCEGAPSGIDYEAVAVTTPVVPNKPYYPFGREPRIFDSFYVGCAEAFGKVGAQVSLCFTLGGPALGPIAAVSDGVSLQLFGVGTDGQLYRAVFAGDSAVFAPVPGPRYDGDGVSFPPQAFVAARVDMGKVRVAVADKGAVHVAHFTYGVALTESSIEWQRLAGGIDNAEVEVRAIFLGNDAKASVHALAGKRLLVWTTERGAAPALAVTDGVIDLLPVQGDADAALLLILLDSGKLQVDVQHANAPERTKIAVVERSKLAAEQRAAWARTSDPENREFFVAGYDAKAKPDDTEQKLRLAKLNPDDVTEFDYNLCPALPIAFESPPADQRRRSPTLVVATSRPTRFMRLRNGFKKSVDPSDIGASDNKARRMMTVQGKTVVQHGDQGLLYRPSAGDRTIRDVTFPGNARFVAAKLLAGAEWLVFDTAPPNGEGFMVRANADGDGLLLPLQEEARVDRESPARLFTGSTEGGQVSVSNGIIELAGSTANRDVHILLTRVDMNGLETRGIWHLALDALSTRGGWIRPDGFPDADAASLNYQVLEPMLDAGAPFAAVLDLREYFLPNDPRELPARLSQGPLQSFYATQFFSEMQDFGGLSVLRIDHELLDVGLIRFAEAPAPWVPLGPNQPANPALSWEYWNGASWWALDTGDFRDRTANLLVDGGVFFTVPDDLEETEVGGRKNRWIRARLVGGDYGEARVTIETEDMGDGKSQQTVTRDLSAIRAPFVVDLKPGYCTQTLERPEIVLTEDNLGVMDQTNANLADLPIALFPPVSFAMGAFAAPAASPEDDDCCEDREEQPVADEPAPVPPAPAFSRALLIGLDQPAAGTSVSLFFDAAPVGGQRELSAQVFRDGRFNDVHIVADTTGGLGESGTIAIDIEEAPNRVAMFGKSAHWLRLTAPSLTAPIGDKGWSPQVRGVYLNGVSAASVETRTMENVGTSSGVPDQEFLLAAAPLDPESLDLRVAEPLGDDEARSLGALDAIEGMRGPWVRWQMVDELPPGDQESPQRMFTLDAETGALRFGNGRNALVPTMGSAVLALTYRHVTGAAANAVAPGAQLQMVSPIAGIDRVTALDSARGGADVEEVAATRARAPAKIRHGGYIVTLADIEDYILAREPDVAQARAANWRGGVRLVIAGRGAGVAPTPAALRAIEEDVRAVAAYGVGAPGRLTAVAPRPLPIEVTAMIDPDPGVDAAGLFQEARTALVAWFDHERGGYDGRGWPVGSVPSVVDVAAALESFADRSVVVDVVIARSDRSAPFPEPFPADVLVRVDATRVHMKPDPETTG